MWGREAMRLAFARSQKKSAKQNVCQNLNKAISVPLQFVS
jgi:hypothetical protein